MLKRVLPPLALVWYLVQGRTPLYAGSVAIGLGLLIGFLQLPVSWWLRAIPATGLALGLALGYAVSFPGDAWARSLLHSRTQVRLEGSIFVFASGQKLVSTGGTPSGRERSPQVRAITSGKSSIAMSQRTPSHWPATRVNSPSIARRRPGWR